MSGEQQEQEQAVSSANLTSSATSVVSSAASASSADSYHSHNTEPSSPFFADATLDLEDAHNIPDDDGGGSGGGVGLIAATEATNMNRNSNSNDNKNNNDSNNDNIPTIEMTHQHSHNIPNQSQTNNLTPPNNDNIPNSLTRISSPPIAISTPPFRPRPPRKPRDVLWAISLIIIIPTSLLFASSSSHFSPPSDTLAEIALSPLVRTSLTLVVFMTAPLVIGTASQVYNTPGGGDGDDSRHAITTILERTTLINPVAEPLMVLAIYRQTPAAWPVALVPLLGFLREALILREWASHVGMPQSAGGDNNSSGGGTGPWGALRDDGRRMFWKELVSMSLDILSRSFRRKVWLRLVVLLCIVQAFFVLFWMHGVMACLSRRRWFLLVVFVAGYWFTAFLMRLLGLVSTGGIMSWFVKEGLLIEDFERGKKGQSSNTTNHHHEQGSDSQGYFDKEAYSSREAYSSIRDYDEGMDDEYPQDDDDDINSGNTIKRDDGTNGGGNDVKSFLLMGLTVNLGSIAQCALTGSLAQFLWAAMRNLDDVDMLTIGNINNNTTRDGLTPMTISDSQTTNSTRQQQHHLKHIGLFLKSKIREFITNNSDFAITHVAAYFKSYTRAANDVLTMIDNTGVEPIIHDDISTPMLSTTARGLASVVTLLLFYSLVGSNSSSSSSSSSNLSDYAICETCALAYIMVYTMVFTILEPLRACVKAIYVCFAQNPQSLRHAFPLIFHRLSRISETNMME